MGKSWSDKRRRIRNDIAECFARKSGIGLEEFKKIFLSDSSAPPVMDFNSQYLGGREVLEDIFEELSGRSGLTGEKIESHYHREETFAQFAEHLLRAGAYMKEDEN